MSGEASLFSQPINSPGPAAKVVTSFTEKVHDLRKLLDGLDATIQTLAHARDKVNEAVAVLEEAGGITVRARDTLKTDFSQDVKSKRVGELEERFRSAMKRLDAISEKGKSNGINLLAGQTLVTKFDDSGKNALETPGIDISCSALEIREPVFGTADGIQNSRIDIMNAIDIAITLRHVISSDIILIQTRQEFSQETVSALSSGSDHIAVGNVSEEAANLLALQIRQQLEMSDISLASESQQYLLKQF